MGTERRRWSRRAKAALSTALALPILGVGLIGFAHTPCPTVRCLENEFYPNAATIVRAVEAKLGMTEMDLSKEDFSSHERRFKGPF